MGKITSFEFKNVRSYGNKTVSIPFDLNNGLVLISGENGAGKTSIVEGLEFSIYGSSSRVNIKDLPNWMNDNLQTCVKFDTDDNRKVTLSRGISPDFYDLEIDNGNVFRSKDESKKKENKANKVKIDKIVEDELYGIASDIFANNILLSIHDFKSFINMKVADKRKIIDKIFQTDVFNDMNDELKKELKDYREKLNVSLNLISSKQESYDFTKSRLDEILKTIDNKTDEALNKLRNDILAYTANINKNIEKRTELYNNIVTNKTNWEVYLANVTSAEKSAQKIHDDSITKINEEYRKTYNEYKAKYDFDKVAKLSNIETIKQLNTNTIPTVEITLSDYNSKLGVKIFELDTKYNNDIINCNTYYTTLLNGDVLSTYNTDISKLDIDFSKKINNIELNIESINSRLSDNKTKYTNYSTILSEKKTNASVLEKQLELYNNDKCPECGIDLDKEPFHVHKHENITKDLELAKNEVYNNTCEFNYISDIINDLNKQYSDAISLKHNTQIEYTNQKNDITSKYNTKLNEIKTEQNTKLSELYSVYKSETDKLQNEKTNIEFVEKTKYDTLIGNINTEYINECMKVNNDYSEKINELNKNLQNYLESETNKTKDILSDAQIEILNKTTPKIAEFKVQNDILSNLYNECDNTCADIEKRINELKIQLATLENGDSTKTITELNNILTQLDAELAVLNAQKLEHEANVWKCENTQHLIGENGLKRVIMNKILPSFNKSISKITTLFDFKYRFMFDENFDAHLSYCGKPIPVTVSRGEGKIMDIIVILSTLQLILMRHPNMNILFLDEIFSNLDINNIAKSVSILKDYAKTYNLTIFVMSHTPVPYEMFDRIIEVSYDGNYSNILIK